MKISNKITQLIKDGFFHIMIGNVLVKMIAFLSSIVIVRLVSKQDYGYLAYADNLYQYINLLSGLGLSTAILKFCSPKVEDGINKYYLTLAMKVGVSFQFIVSILLCIGVFSFDIPFPDARLLVLALILYPIFTQIVTTLQSYVRAKLDNKLYARMGVVQTIVVFVVSIPATLLLGIYGVVAARYISMAVIIFIGIQFLKKDLPSFLGAIVPAREEICFFWRMAISMMFANLFSMIMPINEMFLINSTLKDELIAANYKVAVLIPSQIMFITSSVVVYLFPKIAQLSDKLKEALCQALKVEIILFILISFICGIGYFTCPFFINLIYGSKYADAVELSKLYWVVYGINAGFRMLPMNVLPAVGSTVFNSVVSIVFCAIHAILLYYFIGVYGIYGAAYALLVVYLVSGFVYWGYLYYKCIFASS